MKRSLKILFLLALILGTSSVEIRSADEKKIEAKQKIDEKNGQVDWQKLLGALRERFATSQDTTLQQTRIDKAFFTINEDDPDLPPFLNFKGITIRTAHDDEKKMKDFLLKELGKLVVPGVKSIVKIDEIAFRESPIYTLQDAAVLAFKKDATLNAFFERATYAADGSLQLHTLCLRYDESTNAKVAKLLADNPLAADLIRLPIGKQTKGPTVIRRDHDWLGQRLGLQRQFADDPDALLTRTRLDDGYLQYSKDRKAIHFHVNGVCIHPPALVADAERSKRWKAKLSGLIPKVAYEPMVTGIAMLPNPSITWQNLAASLETHDDIFFHLAKFDAQGKLKLEVRLPIELRRTSALQIAADVPAQAKLVPIDEKSFTFRVWSWHEVLPKAQKRLAKGDFLLQRTRVDRMFLKYEPTRGEPVLHINGVSLHPTEVEPADQLRVKLEPSFTDILPIPLDHKLVTERIRFLTSPIYGMQAEAVSRSLDGLLFANGRYDANGDLHLAIVTGTKGQREEAEKIVGAKPLPPGVTRMKDQPQLDFTDLAWADFLNETQHWMARSSDPLLRKSRLDRGFFSYPASKIGPDLNLPILGIYPSKDAYNARLSRQIGAFARIAIADQLRAGPIAAVPTVESIANPTTVVQAKVPEHTTLDGVRLDDASFDKDKKLILHGIWTGKEQQTPLEKLLRVTLTPAHPALKHGINWNALQTFDIAGLLLSMRTWIAEQDAIDEVWLERLYFDAKGDFRVAGFYTRPQDRDKAVPKLTQTLPTFESKKLPSIDGEAPSPKVDEKKEVPVVFLQGPKDDGPFKLDQLQNIGQHLRDSIPKSFKCDGLRIDRCYYDPHGIFHIEGLADHPAQTLELRGFLDGPGVPFDRKRQLGKAWTEGRQTVIPLFPMMVSLRENLPSLSEFDGLTLTRAYHDPKNRLVLSGNAIGDHDAKQLTETLKRLLDTHPRWQLRITAGVVLEITDKKAADRELAQRLTMRALHLLQVNIGEARIEPAYPTPIGWWSHGWPFDEKLPRVRPTDDDYERALQSLDAALVHNPNSTLAWYLRGYCLQTKNRSDLSLRDFRRMAAMETEDKELRHNRILDLELVQGKLRQSAYRIEQDAIVQVADGWTLRILPESPVAGDPMPK
ncbi:MAG: hypothetical protein EXR98_09145 [Gemmataceae bacterium]|nr:hypothetical protein [Gemmataceae bacterium]